MKLEIYKEGKENLGFHLKNGEILTKEANTALSIVMAAGLGSLGLAAHSIEKSAPLFLTVALLLLSFHLLGVSALIVRWCLNVSDVMPAANEPKNLNVEGCTWEEIVDRALDGLQWRIEFNRDRTENVGKWLTRLRFAAFAAPITFLLGLAVGSVVERGAEAVGLLGIALSSLDSVVGLLALVVGWP